MKGPELENISQREVIEPTQLRMLIVRLQNYYVQMSMLAAGTSMAEFTATQYSAEGMTRLALSVLGALGFVSGTGILGLLHGGRTTLNAYLDTFEHFNKHGVIDDRWLLASISVGRSREPGAYCWRRGVELAMRDLGKKPQWDAAAKSIGLNPDHDTRI
jgi:hypothetical protein